MARSSSRTPTAGVGEVWERAAGVVGAHAGKAFRGVATVAYRLCCFRFFLTTAPALGRRPPPAPPTHRYRTLRASEGSNRKKKKKTAREEREGRASGHGENDRVVTKAGRRPHGGKIEGIGRTTGTKKREVVYYVASPEFLPEGTRHLLLLLNTAAATATPQGRRKKSTCSATMFLRRWRRKRD